MFLPRTQLTHLVIWLEDEPEHCCSPCSQTTSRQSDCITAVFSSACVRHFKLHRFLQVRTRHGRLDALDSSVGPAYIVPPWACPFSILGRHGLSAEVQKDNEVLHPFHQILISWHDRGQAFSGCKSIFLCEAGLVAGLVAGFVFSCAALHPSCQ